MSNFIYGNVLCPFFKDTRENTQAIICEGVKQNTSIHLIFNNKLRQKEYMNELCCYKYKQCNIAKMLFKKYEEIKQ